MTNIVIRISDIQMDFSEKLDPQCKASLKWIKRFIVLLLLNQFLSNIMIIICFIKTLFYLYFRKGLLLLSIEIFNHKNDEHGKKHSDEYFPCAAFSLRRRALKTLFIFALFYHEYKQL